MSLCLNGFFFFSTPRLVALEVDSEEENTEPKSPLSPLSSDVKKSELKRETFHPSPDLPCSRSQSASSACEPATKVKHRLRLLSNTSVYLTTLMFFCFFLLFALCRNWMTKGFGCVHIPTLQKSVCVRILPATAMPQISVLVSNTGSVTKRNPTHN